MVKKSKCKENKKALERTKQIHNILTVQDKIQEYLDAMAETNTPKETAIRLDNFECWLKAKLFLAQHKRKLNFFDVLINLLSDTASKEWPSMSSRYEPKPIEKK